MAVPTGHLNSLLGGNLPVHWCHVILGPSPAQCPYVIDPKAIHLARVIHELCDETNGIEKWGLLTNPDSMTQTVCRPPQLT